MKIYPLKYFLKNKNVMLSALEVLNISVSKSTNIKIHLSMAHFNVSYKINIFKQLLQHAIFSHNMRNSK